MDYMHDYNTLKKIGNRDLNFFLDFNSSYTVDVRMSLDKEEAKIRAYLLRWAVAWKMAINGFISVWFDEGAGLDLIERQGGLDWIVLKRQRLTMRRGFW